MKKLIAGLMLALCAIGAQAQFVSGQVLTAAQLNAQFALYLPLSGGTVSGGVTVNGPLTVNGLLTATGNIGLSSLAVQAANTVVANITGASASPSAAPVPSCNTSASALNYATSGAGFSCNTAINAAQLGGATFAAPTAIGSTTPNTGTFTTLSTTGLATLNSVSTSSATISGGSVNGTPVGATTASTGAFTTLTTSSTYTPSSTAGIVGTTTNDNANAGSWGEYQSATGAATGLTNASYVDLATLSLTAGDWDVTGVVSFNPAGSTVVQAMIAGLSTTANTAPSFPNQTQLNGLNLAAGSANFITAPTVRFSLSATTTIRLGGQANFTTSTLTATGFIRARRVR